MRASILMMIVGMFLAAAPNIAAADDNSGAGKIVQTHDICHVKKENETAYMFSMFVKTKGVYYGFKETKNGQERDFDNPIPNYIYYKLQCELNVADSTYKCQGVKLDLDDVAANKISAIGTVTQLTGLKITNVMEHKTRPLLKNGRITLQWGIYTFNFVWNAVDKTDGKNALVTYNTANGVENGSAECQYECWDETAPQGKEHECAIRQ